MVGKADHDKVWWVEYFFIDSQDYKLAGIILNLWTWFESHNLFIFVYLPSYESFKKFKILKKK